MNRRLHFDFVGTSCTHCTLDPDEYRGLTVPAITQEIIRVLREIAPGVDFFGGDVVDAAFDIDRLNDA